MYVVGTPTPSPEENSASGMLAKFAATELPDGDAGGGLRIFSSLTNPKQIIFFKDFPIKIE